MSKVASKCCGAPAHVEGNTTRYYVCDQCHQPTDLMTQAIPKEQWIEEAYAELVKEGFNNAPGVKSYAEALAIRDYPELTPKQSVEHEISQLE